MTEYVESLINETYPIVLPKFRHEFFAARPNWERGRLEHCAELMKPGMTVFDVGCEHGDLGGLYKLFVGDSGDVIPIEPMGHYWPFIRGVWKANGFTDPSLYYVGLIGIDESGPRRPFERTWPVESEGEGVPDGGFAHLKSNRDLPVSTIDTIGKLVRPDVIVIDIEGAELLALQGARLVLRNHKPVVYVSVHDVADGDWPGPTYGWYRHTIEDIDAYMDEMGYDVEELPQMGAGERFMVYTPQ